jgi:hypothetical protein
LWQKKKKTQDQDAQEKKDAPQTQTPQEERLGLMRRALRFL